MMKEGLLANSTDFASKPLRDQLKRECFGALLLMCYRPRRFMMHFIGAAIKADQVFLPVLENSSKAQKLRTTLGVFERSRFFFNLPGFLVESIEAVCSIITFFFLSPLK